MVLLALGRGEEEPSAERTADLEFTTGGSTTISPVGPRKQLLRRLLPRKDAGDCRPLSSTQPAPIEASTPQSGRVMASSTGGDAPALRVFSLLLLAALTAAVVQQGAYYRAGQALVAVLIGLSLLLALVHQPWARTDLWHPALWPFILLAAWSVLRSTAAGDTSSAAGIVTLLLGLVAVVVVCRRTSDRQMLAASVVALGVLVALSGWIGVLWRITSLAQEDQGLWRVATTLTYSNAAAGFLAPVALLALGRAAARPDAVSSMVCCVLLAGVATTLSRAGALALVFGLATLVLLLRPARAASVLVGPVAGAAIAVVGLLPSVPADARPRPMLAVGALVVGLAVAAGLAGATDRARIVVLAFVVGLGAMAVAHEGGDALDAVRAKRLVVSSSDRARELDAALDVARAHPLTGVGPGRAVLEWTGPSGPLRARYVHNEYVQVLVELGGVGIALLLAALVAVAQLVARSAAAVRERALWAGAAAGLVALAVGSAFDFLWHVPAVPLVGALLVGLMAPGLDRSHPSVTAERGDAREKERACN